MKQRRHVLTVSLLVVVLGFTTFFGSFCKVKLPKEKRNQVEENRGVFFSYLEIEKYFQNIEETEAKDRIRYILDFLEDKNFNMILLQVRSFSDAIYPSKIYPISKTLVGTEGRDYPFDFLDYFIEQAHQRGIEVHAWINPYRVRNNTDIGSISLKNPAYPWLGTNKVQVIENQGIYYNPASLEVQDLIIQGIEELMTNYDIDGIHFDDYFYPNDTIDQAEYEEYQMTMTRDQFHLAQVNQLIRRVYETVKKKEGLVFGISPEGNIDNNYQRNFADVRTWLKEDGYIDYIMPQIYYGFENGVKPFENTVEEWNALIQNDVVLLPALALYKAGLKDQYAKGGINEWQENSNIIKREIEFSRTVPKYRGFSLFRFDYLYSDTDNQNLQKEREHIFELLKK